MMEKKINLEKILRQNNVSIDFLRGMVLPDGHKGSQGDRIIESMKDTIRQALELAASNLPLEVEINKEVLFESGITYLTDDCLDKFEQSILDVINLIE